MEKNLVRQPGCIVQLSRTAELTRRRPFPFWGKLPGKRQIAASVFEASRAARLFSREQPGGKDVTIFLPTQQDGIG